MDCFLSSRTLALLSQIATSSRCCCGCCCCCCVCHLLFNVTLGAGLGASSLSKCTRSPLSFLETTRSIHSRCIVIYAMIANDFVCQNSIPWSWALCNRTQYTRFCIELVLFHWCVCGSKSSYCNPHLFFVTVRFTAPFLLYFWFWCCSILLMSCEWDDTFCWEGL